MPAEDYHATHEVEVVKLGGHGIGFAILQLVGSLIAVPFMLFKYQVDVLKNLRAALPETRSKSDEESTEVIVREHS
jgi:hypothetical protein